MDYMYLQMLFLWLSKNKSTDLKLQGLQYQVLIPICLTIVLLGSCKFTSSDDSNQVVSVKSSEEIPDEIDFNFHVKPILSDKCFKCHGPDDAAREDRIGLHLKEMAFAPINEEGDKYAINPGKPESSELVSRIYDTDPDNIMPPPESNLSLSETEKKILEKWIAQGADWKPHWAYMPPDLPDVPYYEVDEMYNEIDHFILEKLTFEGLSFSELASREKLIRRVSFDLTGLPPQQTEIEAFLSDESAGAYEKVVDRLLSSIAYAERMAVDWMELARYADTHGYQDDFERIMWPWRDWVIHAFDENMPYDQFVINQLAGDMLDDATLESTIASGFNRNHKITAEGGVIEEEYRVEYVADRAHTFGTAFLGVSVECARCHDHKYDPISQKNYYELFSFFNNVTERGMFDRDGMVPEPYITITEEDISEKVSFINNLDKETEIKLMVMEERKEQRPSHVLKRGQYDNPGQSVSPSTPEAILEFKSSYSRDRLGLAQWLFDDDHPLTARVAVNRLWQQLFGDGIVASSFDFGNQGALPTHPELLDFLAVKFRNDGWDIKKMLKYMVMSYTYQQTSNATDEQIAADPQNRWLGRAKRTRLTSEMIRDQVLAVSGLLNTTIGGPSVKPYQPEGLWAETTGGGGGKTAKYIPDKGEKLYRRSLYTYWKRTVPPPGMMTLDASNRDLCTVKRQKTNTPLQALVLLNDPQIIEASRILAQSVIKNKDDLKSCIAQVFFKITSRQILPDELEVLSELYEEEKSYFDKHQDKRQEYLNIGTIPFLQESNISEIASLAVVTSTIFNLDESICKG